MDVTYSVKRYNRFNFTDEEIVEKGLTKDQADRMAARLQASCQGLGATAYTVIPD